MSTYLGYDVLEIEPNDTGGKQDNYERNLAPLDSHSGGVYVVDRSEIAIVRRPAVVWTMHDRAEVQEYRDWLAVRKGALIPFWMPTWRHDLLLAEDLVSGATISIVNTGYTANQFPVAARKHLAFLLSDGTKYYRKVLTSTDEGDTESLEMDEDLPVLAEKATTMVSFLILCRLAVDDPELVWMSSRVAEATLPFVELPQEVATLDEESGS